MAQHQEEINRAVRAATEPLHARIAELESQLGPKAKQLESKKADTEKPESKPAKAEESKPSDDEEGGKPSRRRGG